uniref:tRNA-synt_1d domain-containing protein n=1 Tax=Schistocephalus solidus TaxID=70667 RepID=A0A183TCG3_SCHSO
LGANLYNMYLRRYRRLSGGREVAPPEQAKLDKKAAVATSRTVPADATFLPQTARGVECELINLNCCITVLVQTGVYKPADRDKRQLTQPQNCHRDFLGATDLVLPSFEVVDVLEGMKLLLLEEHFNPKLA